MAGYYSGRFSGAAWEHVAVEGRRVQNGGGCLDVTELKGVGKDAMQRGFQLCHGILSRGRQWRMCERGGGAV